MDAILKLLWGIFGSTLVHLALTTGLPAVVEWLTAKGLPKWLLNGLVTIVKALLGGTIPDVIAEAGKSIASVKMDASLSAGEKKVQIRAIKRQAKRDARRRCAGVGCMPETKALD